MAPTSQLKISELFSVRGFVCVVTGGGTGIGLMCAQALAANGSFAILISNFQYFFSGKGGVCTGSERRSAGGGSWASEEDGRCEGFLLGLISEHSFFYKEKIKVEGEREGGSFFFSFLFSQLGKWVGFFDKSLVLMWVI